MNTCGAMRVEKKVADWKAAQRLQQIRLSNLSDDLCSLTRLNS